MSITIHIYYSGINGNARKFAEEMERTGIAEKIRQENGNISYDYFFPMNDTETVLLIDSWSGQSAIDLHHESPMMKDIIRLREQYDLHMSVERYISDVEGIPDSDQTFIKK